MPSVCGFQVAHPLPTTETWPLPENVPPGNVVGLVPGASAEKSYTGCGEISVGSEIPVVVEATADPLATDLCGVLAGSVIEQLPVLQPAAANAAWTCAPIE